MLTWGHSIPSISSLTLLTRPQPCLPGVIVVALGDLHGLLAALPEQHLHEDLLVLLGHLREPAHHMHPQLVQFLREKKILCQCMREKEKKSVSARERKKICQGKREREKKYCVSA